MKPVAVTPLQADTLLPGAQFADAYAMTVAGQGLDALTAARRAFDTSPGWIRLLLCLRNIIVAPFGLKPGATGPASPATIGIFPLLRQTTDQIVMGLDDRHLDFRLRVDVQNGDDGHQSVTATTAVKTHNWLGRSYLCVILPFHRVIVRSMLSQVGRT